MPESLLLRCPHCRCALKLPEEFLGQVVTCLECRSPFRAPVREGDRLTEPLKLPKTSRIPARIFIPTYGLMLLGFVGIILNGYLGWWFHTDPQAAGQFAEANMVFMLETKPPVKGKIDPKDKLSQEEERKRIDDFGQAQEKSTKDAARTVSVEGMIRIRIISGLISLGVLVGGICFALRKAYYFCFFACLLSALNSPDLGCCFVGVVVGMWGFLMLVSEDGREYFRRTAPR